MRNLCRNLPATAEYQQTGLIPDAPKAGELSGPERFIKKQLSLRRAAQGPFGMENQLMARLFDPRRFALGVMLAAGALLISDTALEAQQRMRVLVPAFEVEGNPRSRTGERLASDVKRHINQMATHAPVEDRPVRDALRRFGLNAAEMSCIQWRQLGQQVDAGLVLCGNVNESTNQVEAAFYNPGGDSYEVPPFTMQSTDQAARHVVEAFGTYVRQLSLVLFCNEDLESENWEQALARCSEAVQLNPRSVSGLYGRGSALAQLERHEEALAAFQTLLEVDQLNQDAMLHAGILTARLGRSDESLTFFQRYLELNPGSEEVRLKVATDLANAGDPAGALRLLEDVVQGGEASGLMLEYAGHFAMNAGLRRTETGAAEEEAARFYRTAVRYYDQAITVRGDSLDNTVYRNLMLAHSRLGNQEQALQFGQRATTVMADDANTWLVYADVLSSARRTEEAMRAFTRAAELNPDLPGINARRAVMMLEAGRLAEAAAAVRAGGLTPEQTESISQRMSQLGFQHAQARRFDQAIAAFNTAREVGRSDLSRAMANFFHGYALFQQAQPLLTDNANAARARQAKPLLEQARTLIQGAGAYQQQATARTQILGNIDQFMEIADALIRAGR
jgi:tetratricopeptide (TPR) repeat protein